MYNTGNAVPSDKLEDMADNAQTFDALVTKTEGTITDRKGVNRRVFQQILMDMGFQPLAGSFQTGATITARNQALYDEVSHVFYAWGGVIPVGGYIVPAGSTPATAGGVGVGAWSDKTDLMLRSYINIIERNFNYVSEMVSDATLETGMLVRVFANNPTSEDGGNTYLIAQAGTETVDNGSIIALTNGLRAVGLFANQQSISPYQFGAIGSGSDDTTAIRNTFKYAKSNSLYVTYNGSSTVLSQIDTFGVPYDFSLATIIISADADATITSTNGSVLLCSDEDTIVSENFNLGSFTEGQGFTSSLIGYGDCSVMIESSELAYTRNDNGSISSVNKNDILLSSYGYHRATPAIFSITTNVKITVRPIRPLIELKLPTFVITGKPSSNQIQALIRSERNNVKFVGGYVNSRDISFQLSTQVLRAYISTHGTVFNYVEDVTTETSALSFCYQVVGFCTYAMRLTRCNDVSGWAVQDGNFIRDTTVEQCVGTRFGSHAMAYNFTSIGCTGTLNGINVCGKGKLIVKDFNFNLTDTSNGTPVTTRADYGQCWDGDIDIDGTIITVGSDSTATTVNVLKLWYSYLTSYDHTSNVVVGKNIKITNTRVVNKKSSQIIFSPIAYNTSYYQPSVMPKTITIDTVFIDGYIRPTYSGFTAHTNPNVSGVTNMYLKNLPNTSGLGELYQLITDATKTSVVNTVIRYFENCTGLNITFSLPASWEINISGSEITVFDGSTGGYSDAGTYNINRNKIPATLFRSNAGKILARDNEFTSITTIGFGAGLVLCSGNTCKPAVVLSSGGGAVDTAAELWSYVNSSYFKI